MSNGEKTSKITHENPDLSDVYSIADLANLAGTTVKQLRRWDRCGILVARRATNGRLRYGFADVVAARTATTLASEGARTSDLKKAVEAIQEWYPTQGHPLASLRVSVEGRHVIVRLDDRLIDPLSRQLILGLDGVMDKHPHAQPENTEAPSNADHEKPSIDLFNSAVKAQRLGQNDQAEKLYRRCLSLDPQHSGALLNLGNIIFEKGSIRVACELYRAATRSTPDLARAWYNLGNALDELEERPAAIESLQQAIFLDSNYADAHFNVALVLEKEGLRQKAKTHWLTYLRLCPNTPSARTARSFLENDD